MHDGPGRRRARGASGSLGGSGSVAGEELFVHIPERRFGQTLGPLHDQLDGFAWDDFVAAPLVVRDRAVGALNAYYRPGHEPDDDEIAFLTAMADQAAVAVDNARLLAEVRGEAALDERHRLARELSPAEVARLGLVRSFQISAVFPHLTVLDNVRIALQRPSGLATQFWRSSAVLSRLDERALELIEAVNLSAYAHLPAVELPYGRKRALEIATTLALDPAMLLLDEPMAGMGHEDIGRISDLIRRIAESRTVLMVEHNLHVVEDLCDRVTVLARGEILADGSYDEVSADPRVREAYMGTEHE